MKLAASKVTERVQCTRCGGKGYGNWRPDYSRCWKCFGAGEVVSKREGADVEAFGWVARPYDLEHEIALVRAILFVESRTPATGEYLLNVFTWKLDGEIHHWFTRTPATGERAKGRVFQQPKPMREMTEEQVAARWSEIMGDEPISELDEAVA